MNLRIIYTIFGLRLPALAVLMAQSSVSIKRINAFFALPKVQEQENYSKTPQDVAMKFQNVCLSWNAKLNILQNLNFSIKKGSLVAIGITYKYLKKN